MHGLMNVVMVVGFVALVTEGTGFLAWANSGTGHDPHGKPPHAGMGYGGGNDEDMGHHGGLSPLAMKESLGLSDEQVNRLHPLEMGYRKTMIQNGAELGVAMVDLGTLMDAKQTEMETITRKVDEIGQLQKNMMMYRVEVFLKVKEVLSPAQYEQFRSRLRAQMEGLAHHGGGKMPERMKGHGEYPGKPHGDSDEMQKKHP
jgi:Spy/CpxP family protein refolding chaperone